MTHVWNRSRRVGRSWFWKFRTGKGDGGGKNTGNCWSRSGIDTRKRRKVGFEEGNGIKMWFWRWFGWLPFDNGNKKYWRRVEVPEALTAWNFPRCITGRKLKTQLQVGTCNLECAKNDREWAKTQSLQTKSRNCHHAESFRAQLK